MKILNGDVSVLNLKLLVFRFCGFVERLPWTRFSKNVRSTYKYAKTPALFQRRDDQKDFRTHAKRN